MPNIFLISDTHFGHEGICHFTNSNGDKIRPFSNAAEMDEFMVERWNKTVRPNDKIYHLGDIAIKRQSIKTLGRLNGQKVLIRGNHDIFKLNDYSVYFKDIRATHRLAQMLVLSHIPLHRDSLKPGIFNVHGHTHVNDMTYEGRADHKYLNMCVEKTEYAPVELEDVLKRVRLSIQDQNSPFASPASSQVNPPSC